MTSAQILALFKGVCVGPAYIRHPEDTIYRQDLYIRYLLEHFNLGAFTFPDGVTFTNVGLEL